MKDVLKDVLKDLVVFIIDSNYEVVKMLNNDGFGYVVLNKFFLNEEN